MSFRTVSLYPQLTQANSKFSVAPMIWTPHTSRSGSPLVVVARQLKLHCRSRLNPFIACVCVFTYHDHAREHVNIPEFTEHCRAYTDLGNQRGQTRVNNRYPHNFPPRVLGWHTWSIWGSLRFAPIRSVQRIGRNLFLLTVLCNIRYQQPTGNVYRVLQHASIIFFQRFPIPRSIPYSIPFRIPPLTVSQLCHYS